jgi:hypothetical protein
MTKTYSFKERYHIFSFFLLIAIKSWKHPRAATQIFVDHIEAEKERAYASMKTSVIDVVHTAAIPHISKSEKQILVEV